MDSTLSSPTRASAVDTRVVVAGFASWREGHASAATSSRVRPETAGFDIVPIDGDILARASALRVREIVPDFGLATHDGELAIAARALGYEVFGIKAR